MLTIKEQTIVYEIGLSIEFFTVEDVTNWADSYILNTEMPDYQIIELSLLGSKGRKELLHRLSSITSKMDITIPAKTLLGLLYKSYSNKIYSVKDIAKKLYQLSTHIFYVNISESLKYELNAIEDTLDFYGEEKTATLIQDLLKDFLIYAENFTSL